MTTFPCNAPLPVTSYRGGNESIIAWPLYFNKIKYYCVLKEGRFVPTGEKERLRALQVFIQNLQIRSHLFANSTSNFYPVTAYLPKEREAVVSELQYIMDTVSEEQLAEYRRNLKSLG